VSKDLIELGIALLNKYMNMIVSPFSGFDIWSRGRTLVPR
jgi:hypothetical protein